jgi:murein DD-endopeptidase MepM/ murein hydrolase activator NlpD
MSINQYIMNSLLENQKVRKRKIRRPELQNSSHAETSRHVSSGKNSQKAFRPAGIISIFEKNSKLIDGVRQNPARIPHRPGYGKAYAKRPPYAGRHPVSRRCPPKKRLPSIAFPALPIAFLALLALGVFFINYSQGAFDWMGREVVTNGEDGGSRQRLALYAGVATQEGRQGGLSDSNGEAILLDMMESFSWQDYKVKKGDSVSKIAAAFSVSMDAIIASNGITNARALREGESLRIPNMDGIPYTVKNGDSLSKISQSMGVPLGAILDANDIQSDLISAGMNLFIPGARMNRDDLRLALGELFMYPLKSARLSSPFGWRDDPISGERRHHAAVDLSAPLGTAVKAAMEGKVTALSYDRTYGNFIILSHPGGYQTMYAHLNSFSVKKGENVAQEAQIGTVGTTGYSTGPHLHFAIFRNSRAVNPLDFLNSQR